MNTIGRLIAELDFRDVEYTTIGEVAEVRSGWGFPNSDQGVSSGQYPFYKVSDMNLPGNELRMNRANNYIDASVASRLRINIAPPGTIIFPKIGAAVATNKKRILLVPSAYDNNVMGLVPCARVLPQFLLYWMQTIDLVSLSNDSGAVPSIRKSEIQALQIPVPSLEVQRSIVQVLDQFTQLQSELEAELEARNRQYDHYLNLLTSAFEPNKKLKEGWALSSIGGACRVEKGRTAIQKAIPGDYPLVATSRERQSSQGYDFDAEAVCIPLISAKGHGVASISRLYYQSGKFALGTILCAVMPNDSGVLAAEFLYYYLRARKDTLLVPLMRGGANVSLTIHSLKSVPIYLPPLEEQLNIAATLRALSALVDDASTGLPAELAARRKQYEYYRDKLLTFEEDAA